MKFLFYFGLEKGYTIIGVIEVLTSLWNVFSTFFFSYRMGATFFFLFNLPLLLIYSQAKRYSMGEMSQEKKETVYKWNSRFLYLYFLRFIFIIIGGFIFLIFITNHDRSVKFVCDRFTSLDYGKE